MWRKHEAALISVTVSRLKLIYARTFSGHQKSNAKYSDCKWDRRSVTSLQREYSLHDDEPIGKMCTTRTQKWLFGSCLCAKWWCHEMLRAFYSITWSTPKQTGRREVRAQTGTDKSREAARSHTNEISCGTRTQCRVHIYIDIHTRPEQHPHHTAVRSVFGSLQSFKALVAFFFLNRLIFNGHSGYFRAFFSPHHSLRQIVSNVYKIPIYCTWQSYVWCTFSTIWKSARI